MRLFLSLCALMIVIAATTAQAKPKEPFVDLPPEAVDRAIRSVRPLLHKMKISDTEDVGQETPEEMADPLLTNDEVEAAIVQGIVSVTADWCGFDGNARSFEPFMKKQRSKGRTLKQIAYIGALHGFGMGAMNKAYHGRVCEGQYKAKLEKYLY